MEEGEVEEEDNGCLSQGRRRLATAGAVVEVWEEELGPRERKAVVRCRRCRVEIRPVGVVLVHPDVVVGVAVHQRPPGARRVIVAAPLPVVYGAGLPPVVVAVLVVSA